jgi:hypothetical protein
MSSEAITLSISISREADAVYAFIAAAENFPQWADGLCKSVRRAGTDWIIETPEGPLGLRMTPLNPFRVADHTVVLGSGVEINVPFRALAAPDGGSVVILTLFRQPGMSDADFTRDQSLVERDLVNLKQVLERAL